MNAMLMDHRMPAASLNPASKTIAQKQAAAGKENYLPQSVQGL